MTSLVLDEIVAMFNSGRTDRAGAVFSSSYVDHQRPEWLDLDGPAEFAAIVELARSSLPGLRVGSRVVVDAGPGYVAAVFVWSSSVGVRETLEVLRVEDGLVVEHWGAEVPTGGVP